MSDPVKLYYVQVLLPDNLSWTTMSIIASSHWSALTCANHFGLVGLATEAVDYERRLSNDLAVDLDMIDYEAYQHIFCPSPDDVEFPPIGDFRPSSIVTSRLWRTMSHMEHMLIGSIITLGLFLWYLLIFGSPS